MALSLKQKSVKGISWNLTERFGLNAMKFVLGIFLARLLTPQDFGLIGMITVFFAVAQVFVESGFGQAYIQKKDASDADANTVFYTNLVISLLVYGLLWVAAPAIAAFYDQPSLVDLTRVMGLVVVINAFNMIQVAQVVRAVDFKRKTRVILSATLLSGVAGVAAAYGGLGVWSLVIQQMANRFLTTAGFWFTSRWRPTLQFSATSFNRLFSFGGWVLASGIVRTIFDNIYILTIGKFFSAAQLGFYTKAKQFQQLSSHQVSGAVGQVAFPVFATLQSDQVRLKSAMGKFLTHSLALTAPICVTLMVVARPFVLLLLTEKWAPMIPYMQILCVAALLYPIHAVNVQVLQAQGRSDLDFKITTLKMVLRVINIAVMYRWGIFFIIIGEVILSFFALAVNTYYTKMLLDYGFIEQFKDIKKTLLASFFAGLGGYAVSHFATNLYLNFSLTILVTISVYLLLQYIFNRIMFMEIMKLKEDLL